MDVQSPEEAAQKQTIFTWKSPLRPYKKRGKNVMRFYIALSLLLSLIVIFFGDKILLIPLWAVMFLFYVLTITPPPEVENKVSVFGVETAGVSLRWESLNSFYFSKRFGYDMLTLIGQPPYSLRSYMVIPDAETKKKITSIFSERLLFQEKPQPTMVDKLVDWFTYLIPDDEEPAKKQVVTESESYSQTPKQASL